MKKDTTFDFIPTSVSKEVRAYIIAIYNQLKKTGQLTEENNVLYINQLVMLAFSYQNYIKAQTQLLESDLLCWNGSGTEKPSPLVGIVNTSLRQCLLILAELGISIKTANKVKTENNDDTPLANILGGKQSK